MPEPAMPRVERRRSTNVPVYSGETIVGRAYETVSGEWAAAMEDGTPLGSHTALVNAQAAILARHHAPLRGRRV